MIRDLLHAVGQLFTWFVVIAPWEQAIRVRAGKHVRLLGAGLYLRIPFVDRVYRQSIRRRMSIIQPQTVTTRDGKTISLAGAVGFEIIDLLKLYETLHQPEDTTECEVGGSIAEYVSTHTLAECRPEVIEAKVTVCLDLARYGLGAGEVRITNFAVVRTYRFITGAPREWRGQGNLDTQEHDRRSVA